MSTIAPALRALALLLVAGCFAFANHQRPRLHPTRARGCNNAEPISDPTNTGNAAITATGHQGRLRQPNALYSFSPVLWLITVGLCLLGCLYLVGYSSKPEDGFALEDIRDLLQGEVNSAALRAALALSGVTMAITVVLAITCVVWAVSASLGASRRHRVVVGGVVLVLFLIALQRLYYWLDAGHLQPFASSLGERLLNAATSNVGVQLASCGPKLMFFLACFVPAVLACGASMLLEPEAVPKGGDLALVKDGLRKRVKEMDQLLYIGALTLVFGTLQLSAAMSVPLASTPRIVDVKSKLELCLKIYPDTMKLSKDTILPPAQAYLRDFSSADCLAAVNQLSRAEHADGLRALVKGVTFAFGLSFSALLAAIYVPGMLVLRRIMEPISARTDPTTPSDEKSAKHPLTDIDPVNRIAAIFATLSPLIAAILANAVAQ